MKRILLLAIWVVLLSGCSRWSAPTEKIAKAYLQSEEYDVLEFKKTNGIKGAGEYTLMYKARVQFKKNKGWPIIEWIAGETRIWTGEIIFRNSENGWLPVGNSITTSIHEKFLLPRTIKRGDLATFLFPSTDPRDFQCGGSQYGKDFTKRVIGLPGEKVEVRDGVVFINGEVLKEDSYAKYIDKDRYPKGSDKVTPEDYQVYWEKRMLGKMFSDYVRDNFGPVVVPAGQYMVMGDDRDRSCDSRYWGPVPEDNIKGLSDDSI